MATSPTSIHLLVLIHGMWGSTVNLAELYRAFKETHLDGHETSSPSGERSLKAADIRLEILLAQTNQEQSTYDGIDWGGERIANEVYTKIEEIEKDGDRKVTHFSAIGYSLGGLLARYMVGILQSKDFFSAVIPVNFITVATPHVGLLTRGSLRMRMFASLGPHLLSRTGEQFYAADKWGNTGKPLLEVMSDEGEIFYEGLTKFKRINIYANAIMDLTVPFVTAAFESHDPFAKHTKDKIKITYSAKYKPIVESCELVQPTPSPSKPFSLRRIFPPPLHWPFNFAPANYVLLFFLPILLPVIISLVLIRMTMHTRASRARIRLLESNPPRGATLIKALRRLEKRMDDAVADMLEEGGAAASTSTPTPNTMLLTPTSNTTSPSSSSPPPPQDLFARIQTPSDYLREPSPYLTPLQIGMMKSLNNLPRLQKHIAYIGNVLNAHSPIIMRDVKRFEFHKRGEGVVRHLVDHFELV